MDRRAILTLLACTVFTLIFFRISGPPGGTPPQDNPAAERTGSGASAPAGGDAKTAAGGDDAEPQGAFPATSATESPIEPYENARFRVEFTSAGGGIDQIYLKEHFKTAADRDVRPATPAQWIALFPPRPHRIAPAFAVRESGAAAGKGLDEVVWEHLEEVGENGRTVVFRYQRGDGLVLEKRIECRDEGHTLGLSFSAAMRDPARAGETIVFLVRAGGGVQDVQRGQWTLEPQAVAATIDRYGEADVRLHTAEQLIGEPVELAGTSQRPVAWAGVSNLYFAALLAPATQGEATAALLAARPIGAESMSGAGAELAVPLAVRAPAEAAPVAFRLFAGPKDLRLLAAEGLASMQPLVEQDYGSWESFRWINKLLLGALRIFHGWFGNYGVAIILLTLLLRLALFPVTRTQQVSMQRYAQKMSVLKPKLDELRERLKNNSQRYAQEQMKLLKEHNVRPPVVGCLSSLVTIPVFVGMFQILRSSIELRQAPFAGWIDDLSLPDHLFTIPGVGIAFNLLPILATLAFLLQMRMAPKSADPQAQQQQKIMMIMPLVFGVMFYGYAAGLSLYMLTSSAYGIVEYKFIRQRFFPQTLPAPVATTAR